VRNAGSAALHTTACVALPQSYLCGPRNLLEAKPHQGRVCGRCLLGAVWGACEGFHWLAIRIGIGWGEWQPLSVLYQRPNLSLSLGGCVDV
jgi:hypothetical protein